MKPYTQLSLEERYHIYEGLSEKKSLKLIAQELGRSTSTISREIKRNLGQRGYRPHQAHEFAQRRRSNNASQITEDVWCYVEEKLKLYWSPEQISGALKHKHAPETYNLGVVSHESIYRYVYEEKRRGGQLYQCLRHRKSYRKRTGTYDKRGCIPNRQSITKRPKIIDERARIGDWEVDTMIGSKHQGAIVTLVERKTGFTLMKKVANKRAEIVTQAILELLAPYQHQLRSITSDNGKEFANHQEITLAFGIQWYFADPYASWQRGTNENTNGLIRQYFPKKLSFNLISDQHIDDTMQQLNHRPRKRLDFKSPYQILC